MFFLGDPRWRATLIGDQESIGKRLAEELGLDHSEAEAYISALKKGNLLKESPITSSLLRRGMLIRGTHEKGYLPVHPRLALSNLFRSYGDRTSAEMREKRKRVDRLTAELILIYESRKGPQ